MTGELYPFLFTFQPAALDLHSPLFQMPAHIYESVSQFTDNWIHTILYHPLQTEMSFHDKNSPPSYTYFLTAYTDGAATLCFRCTRCGLHRCVHTIASPILRSLKSEGH